MASSMATRSGVSAVADFVGAQAEQVAVGRRHARDGPVGGLLGEQRVELLLVPLDAEDELLGELAQLLVLQARGEERRRGSRASCSG